MRVQHACVYRNGPAISYSEVWIDGPGIPRMESTLRRYSRESERRIARQRHFVRIYSDTTSGSRKRIKNSDNRAILYLDRLRLDGQIRRSSRTESGRLDHPES